jgi:hypothetical protein
MKFMSLAFSIVMMASTAFAAKCDKAAIDAAINSAIDSGKVYHCSDYPLEIQEADVDFEDQYWIKLSCVGETGSQALTFDVQVKNDCTNPSVIPQDSPKDSND